MNNLNSILDYLKVFNNINKRPAQEPRNMKLAKYIPRHEMDNMNTKDLEQSPDSFLRPGETLEDWDTTFRRPNAEGGVQQLVRNTADGSRPGYSGEKYTRGYQLQQGSKFKEGFRWALQVDKPGNTTGTEYFQTKKDMQDYKDTKIRERKAISKSPPKSELNKAAAYYNSLPKDHPLYISSSSYDDLKWREAGLGGEKNKVYERVVDKGGKFKIKTQATALSPTDQAKILKEFPDAKFTPQNKYGFKPTDSNYQTVQRFVDNDFKLPYEKGMFKNLPKYSQKELIEAFPEVKFNFDRKIEFAKKGSTFSKYGVPVTHPKYGKISKYFAKSKVWKYNFDLRSPEGWMMSQMERNYAQNGEASPYRPITKKGGPIAKGNPMIGIEHNGKKYNMKTIVDHDDFANTKKYWNIADKTSKKYLSEFDNLAKLLPEGFDPKKIQVNDLLQFISDKDGIKGLNRAKRAIQIHHEYGVGPRATTNYQLLRQDMNLLANKANNLIKTGKLKKIEQGAAKALELNARLVVDDVRYGPEKVSARGDIKNIIAGAETEMQKFTKKDWNKFGNLFRQLCPKGKASGGRIGYQTAGSVGATVECGANELARLLKEGKGNTPLVKKILNSGGNFLKKALNPMELLRLRNLIGPVALGFIGAFETGVITDDVLRMGKPLNESLASNWMTKTFLPYSEEAAKQKNLLQSGKLTTDAQKIYALDMMKLDQAVRKSKQIEGMKFDQTVEQGGYGMIDESQMVTDEAIADAEKDLDRRMEDLYSRDTLTEGSAKEMENIALMDEKAATEMAKPKTFNIGDMEIQYSDGFSPLFGKSGTPLVNKLGKRASTRGPMTEKGKMKIDYSLPTYDRDFNATDDELLNVYKQLGLVHPRFGELAPGSGTYFRMQQPGAGLYGTQDKFAGGGLANLPRTVAPDSEGIMNLKTKW